MVVHVILLQGLSEGEVSLAVVDVEVTHVVPHIPDDGPCEHHIPDIQWENRVKDPLDYEREYEGKSGREDQSKTMWNLLVHRESVVNSVRQEVESC